MDLNGLLGGEFPDVDRPIPPASDESDGGCIRRCCARAIFLLQIDQIVPDAVKELREIARGQAIVLSPEEVRWSLPLRDPIQVGHGVEKWLRKWNLDHSWMFLMGMRGVVHIAKNDSWPESWLRTQIYCPPETAEADHLNLAAISVPSPRASTRAAAWALAVDKVLEEMAEAWARDADAAYAQGYERVVKRPSLGEHVSWLVRYQLLGETFTDIARRERPADAENSGRKSVTEAVRRAASLVGLTLRAPDRGGRPRK
jgi:hypothetical protein